ncbi:dioxygenase [Thioalkalivibrio denitrificans]|uniref:Dioxygenase n=1 Tax=Thioalkalivibrio denitrificans TaxID=108003 RepID=A0A1V3NLE2_9GAMM|nr:class III extradiol ring-cleavage dioxygenase [Thioalkalivibrio denitrificans]OOG25698.1 dioxygenase [Thioalkalivibrio denitrificans]
MSRRSAPILYIPHGGGPLPLMGDPGHRELAAFLRAVSSTLETPSAIVVISAHWETDVPMLTGAGRPGLIYDYYGFPEEAYRVHYPAPGDPQLAGELQQRLEAAGLQGRTDPRRGFDHGLFIPLKLMYPDAQIPCVQLSLLDSLDPAAHIALGRAVADVRDEGVMVLGSGLSFHNMRALMDPGMNDNGAVDGFHGWLTETCTSPDLSPQDRERRLCAWQDAPGARFCHPREEHLLPLHVCYGVACGQTPAAQVVFDGPVMGRRAVALQW